MCGMDVKALVAAVLSRGLRILLVTVLLLVATAAILLFVPKSYESSASLLVEPAQQYLHPRRHGGPFERQCGQTPKR